MVTEFRRPSLRQVIMRCRDYIGNLPWCYVNPKTVATAGILALWLPEVQFNNEIQQSIFSKIWVSLDQLFPFLIIIIYVFFLVCCLVQNSFPSNSKYYCASAVARCCYKRKPVYIYLWDWIKTLAMNAAIYMSLHGSAILSCQHFLEGYLHCTLSPSLFFFFFLS